MESEYIGNLVIGSVQRILPLSLFLCGFKKFLFQCSANAHRES